MGVPPMFRKNDPSSARTGLRSLIQSSTQSRYWAGLRLSETPSPYFLPMLYGGEVTITSTPPSMSPVSTPCRRVFTTSPRIRLISVLLFPFIIIDLV